MNARWRKIRFGGVALACAIVFPLTALAVEQENAPAVPPVPDFAKSRQLVADFSTGATAALWAVPASRGAMCRYLTISRGPAPARPAATSHAGGSCVVPPPGSVARASNGSLSVEIGWIPQSEGGFAVVLSGAMSNDVATVSLVSGNSKTPVAVGNRNYITQLPAVATIGRIADAATTRVVGFDTSGNEVESVGLEHVLRSGGWTS